MATWDDVIGFYQDLASMRETLHSSIGNTYLNIIRLLQEDSETANTVPGTAMFTLYVALADYDDQSVHIHWVIDTDVYAIFLTPDLDEEPDAIRVTLIEVVPTVKTFLQQLRIKRDQT